MGLDTSHDCWSGPYSQFHRWRVWIAKGYCINLSVMSGFAGHSPSTPYTEHLSGDNLDEAIVRFIDNIIETPTGWDFDDPIQILLSHSDCDGKIRWWHCKRMAVQLSEIARRNSKDKDAFSKTWIDDDGKVCKSGQRGIYDGMVPATLRFCEGLIRAYKSREDVLFR